jgi:hypothetical protein
VDDHRQSVLDGVEDVLVFGSLSGEVGTPPATSTSWWWDAQTGRFPHWQ